MDTPLTILSQWEDPTLLLARVWGDSMYFLPGEDKPIWIPVDSTFKGRLMDSTFKGSNNEAMDGNDDGQHPGESHSSRAIM